MKRRREKVTSLCFPSAINKAEFNIFLLYVEYGERDIYLLIVDCIDSCLSLWDKRANLTVQWLYKMSGWYQWAVLFVTWLWCRADKWPSHPKIPDLIAPQFWDGKLKRKICRFQRFLSALIGCLSKCSKALDFHNRFPLPSLTYWLHPHQAGVQSLGLQTVQCENTWISSEGCFPTSFMLGRCHWESSCLWPPYHLVPPGGIQQAEPLQSHPVPVVVRLT